MDTLRSSNLFQDLEWIALKVVSNNFDSNLSANDRNLIKQNVENMMKNSMNGSRRMNRPMVNSPVSEKYIRTSFWFENKENRMI